jgi:hypothetical protein
MPARPAIQVWSEKARREPLLSAGLLILLVMLLWAAFSVLRSDEPDPTASPLTMRRLTEAQYRATIEDIFGQGIELPGRFERPLRSEGLAAIGTGQAGMSAFAMEQYAVNAQVIAAAALAPERRRRIAPCMGTTDRVFDAPCARSVVTSLGQRLYRRPLSSTEVDRYVSVTARAHDQVRSFGQAMQLGLYAMLISPDFLFRVEHTVPDATGRVAELDAYSKATRLSFFLTNSAPDAELLRAAAAGELDSGRGVDRQVSRLMASPRFEGAVRAFFADMLRFDGFADVTKDPAIYPTFTPAVAGDAQEQTLRTITDHLITQAGDYRDLFTTRSTMMTRALGVIYRTPVATRNGWERVRFDDSSPRAGIQSHISFLALYSHPGRSSPTLRGRALREVFLCQDVPDPPPSVNTTAIDESSSTRNVTSRDRIARHASEPSCAGCHNVMDPIGLTLDNFDSAGRWRARENGALINASGELDGTAIASSTELADALRNHPETPRCLVERLYKSAVGRDIAWRERSYLDWLIAGFADDGYRLPDLMRRIATSEQFLTASPARIVPERIAARRQRYLGER